MTLPDDRAAAASQADQHHRAVMNTLRWADEAAAAGDFAGAIAWLDVITAMGDELPHPYPDRRAVWQADIRNTAARHEEHRDAPEQRHRWSAVETARAAA